MRLVLMVVCLLVGTTALADARVIQSVSRSYAAAGIGVVDLDVPAGEVRIEAIDADSVRVTMTARCRGNIRKCARNAGKLSLLTDRRGRTLDMRLKGVPKFNWDGLSVELLVQVPKDLEVLVDMGAGELVVLDLERDLDVDMGAGDVTVVMPEETVESVDLRLTIGDATLRTREGSREASGIFTGRIDWHRGRGSARVDIGLAVGTVDVKLR